MKTIKLSEARKIAKANNRKIKVKTINFDDGRGSKRFWTISPDFKVIFPDFEARQKYIQSLTDGELELYTTDALQDSEGLIKYC